MAHQMPAPPAPAPGAGDPAPAGKAAPPAVGKGAGAGAGWALPRPVVLAASWGHLAWAAWYTWDAAWTEWDAADRAVSAATVAVLLVWYSAVRAALPAAPEAAHRRSRAWIVSLLTAVACSAVGLTFIPSFLDGGIPALVALSASEPGLSRPVTVAYMTQLVVDEALALADYEEEMGALSGWFHHTLYLFVDRWLLLNRTSGATATLLAVEVPTAILAAGSVYKPWRLDIPFGATFFAFRVVMCVWMTVGHYLASDIRAFWMIAAPITCMHLFWFRGWLVGYARRRREAAAARAKAAKVE
jgi:hypothetical protein